MPDGFGTPPHIQPGPCVLCGAADYPLSTGGPSICCLCDCTPAQGRVRHLGEENRQLRARIAELEALMPGGFGVRQSPGDGVCIASGAAYEILTAGDSLSAQTVMVTTASQWAGAQEGVIAGARGSRAFTLSQQDCEEIGGHCFDPTGETLMSSPPQYPETCRHCGKRRIGTPQPPMSYRDA